MLDILKRLLIDKDIKICTKCNKVKLVSEFSKSSKSKDGLQGYCKECNKKYQSSLKSSYIYFIIQDKQVMYIGSTVNIKKRISNHLKGETTIKNYMNKGSWTEIKYIEFEDITRQELFMLEGILIEEIMPTLNQAKVGYQVSESRTEYITELAYNTLEYYQELSKLYKKNYTKIA